MRTKLPLILLFLSMTALSALAGAPSCPAMTWEENGTKITTEISGNAMYTRREKLNTVEIYTVGQNEIVRDVSEYVSASEFEVDFFFFKDKFIVTMSIKKALHDALAPGKEFSYAVDGDSARSGILALDQKSAEWDAKNDEIRIKIGNSGSLIEHLLGGRSVVFTFSAEGEAVRAVALPIESLQRYVPAMIEKVKAIRNPVLPKYEEKAS